MSAANLTARYRPQTFAEVAGQEALKAILSRAAAENAIAPAYLFSGTRGVGKTTIARILAKAVNCERGPAAEPCNECVHCRQITAGAAVDVVEIDAASNRGIDEARRLKEDIGYAPIQCRYKVFIIDEAHMLTREAFNALLKTLEEPPPHATFIMATTEPHKFPATIISRCQHYVFKRLSQRELEAHLNSILGREGIGAEAEAVSLLARRGAGSVRDSMSLLGQVLAMGGESLTEADVRTVLGLAGQEIFFALLEAVRERDLAALVGGLRNVLDQGLDIGFFLRELAQCWRNLFLIKQAGEAAPEILEMPVDEVRRWEEFSQGYETAHIHACWQMTLEGQRRVLTSLEPALALELLLLNLAYLPELVSLDSVGSPSGAGRGPGRGPGSPAPGGGQGYRPQAPGPVRRPAPNPAPNPTQDPAPAKKPWETTPEPPQAPEQTSSLRSSAPEPPTPEPPVQNAGPEPAAPPARPSAPAGAPKPWDAPQSATPPVSAPYGSTPSAPSEGNAQTPPNKPDWEGFLDFIKAMNGDGADNLSLLKSSDGSFTDTGLVVSCRAEYTCNSLKEPARQRALAERLAQYAGRKMELTVKVSETAAKHARPTGRAEMESDPLVLKALDMFDAKLL